MTAYHEPISDMEDDQYAEDLFRGVLKLHQLKTQCKGEVFMHCTAGVSRSPTLLLVYLALYIKHKEWRSIHNLYDFLESEYRFQDANKLIAQRVIESKQGREL
jgi:protein-tyrosine phosphatase